MTVVVNNNPAAGTGVASSQGGIAETAISGTNSSSTAAGRLEWMRLLTSWGYMDELCTHIKLQRREQCVHVANYLCPNGGDPTTGKESRTLLWMKRQALAERIDICSSQALGCAVTVITSIISYATQVGNEYMDILIRSLKVGFLIGFQSFLSTQGDELGMLEDLDCAILWLNLVTVRLVPAVPVAPGTRNSGVPAGTYDFADGFNHNARSIGITHLMNNTVLTADGTKIPVGKCDGITLRRGIVSIPTLFVYIYSIDSVPL